jgi:hypothetical protein
VRTYPKNTSPRYGLKKQNNGRQFLTVKNAQAANFITHSCLKFAPIPRVQKSAGLGLGHKLLPLIFIGDYFKSKRHTRKLNILFDKSRYF